MQFFSFDTPALRVSGTVCLRFWYHIFGKNIGQLLVYMLSLEESQPAMFQVTESQGNEWREAVTTIENFQFLDRVGILYEFLRVKY